jgi:hypothetical protein
MNLKTLWNNLKCMHVVRDIALILNAKNEKNQQISTQKKKKLLKNANKFF